jgi:ubiquinone/menaquinone biosynthesis C-methylase UbiE
MGDAQGMPFKSNFFDKILMTEVIEHIPDPEAAILEACRVLKKGGKIVVSTPDLIMNYGLKVASQLPLEVFKSCKYSVKEHLWYVNDKRIKKILVENGFQVVRSNHFISKVFPINNIVCAVKI